MRLWKKHILFAIVNKSLRDLPTPSNLSYFWNFGSLLGLCLLLQIISGIFLAMHYSADINIAFPSIVHISKDVNYGFLLRYLHANGASLFFFVVYLHIGRGLFYGSYFQTQVWFTGITIFFFMMLTAFIGYVLPWGQMSFWGATVITNLLSAIPYIGSDIVLWVWGGFSVSNATLNRFYSLHYLLPFLLFSLVLIHLVFLHTSGSNNPLGVKSEVDKVPFHSYFVFKDLLGYFFVLIFFVTLVFLFSNLLNDPENYIRANPLVTPAHIQPEWYFLFAYAILRSVPNKLGGVLLMGLSIVILFFVPLFHTSQLKGLTFRPLGRLFFWFWIINFWFLTWIGSQPVENPYIQLGQFGSCFYFLYFIFFIPVIGVLDNWLLYENALNPKHKVNLRVSSSYIPKRGMHTSSYLFFPPKKGPNPFRRIKKGGYNLLEKELKKEKYIQEMEEYLKRPEIKETMKETSNFIIKRVEDALDNNKQSSFFDFFKKFKKK